jgi:DNA-binding MarR family transcriptional regulator
MIGDSKSKKDILRYLKEVYESRPFKSVRGIELINDLNLREEDLNSTLKFLEDLGFIKMSNKSYDSKAFLKITEKGLKEIESI